MLTFTEVQVESDHSLGTCRETPRKLKTFWVQSGVGLDPLVVWPYRLVMDIEVVQSPGAQWLYGISITRLSLGTSEEVDYAPLP